MAISHVLLLVTEVKPCWPELLLGWVTFLEISVVGFVRRSKKRAECIVELSTREFLRTREKCGKARAECS